MPENAKNQLLQLLKNLGCVEDCADFQLISKSPGPHRSTVTVKFPDGRTVQGTGEAPRRTDADIAATQVALNKLRDDYKDLVIDWGEIYVQAQAGDALIKLGVYLSAEIKSVGDKSKRLQTLESDLHLAKVFDQWKAQGDKDLAVWGTNLGEKRKATLVEALLWKRFGKQVITTDAPVQLQSLLRTLLQNEG
ncbi:hypothetical protein [Leptolyngbya sp. FACHB-261]|uniref:hypothetical protein n=1 Tax=Leptolyngbya sp. FACHB-261 TaxID=2692806 RepID=UPI001688E607|nr:hypothetical protein [Leptolyngbya sp. FACHB-261]MBD2102319.1 hypothetical protein [Leptolyngbya sp. FACHB-261]